jgi:hypothetical protein
MRAGSPAGGFKEEDMRHPSFGHKAAWAARFSFGAILLGTVAAANAPAASAARCGPADPALAGHYYLDGEEIGSELLLRADGRFEYLLAYGAADARAQGCWRRSDRQVVLETLANPGSGLRLLKRASVDGSASPESLRPVPWTDRDEGAVGDTVVVAVGHAPDEASAWVEYADGRQVAQRIDAGGRARFARTGMPPVRRVGVGLAGAAVPVQWFDNEEAGRRLFLIDTDAADRRTGLAAFRRMELEVTGPGRLSAHLGQGVTGRYERR